MTFPCPSSHFCIFKRPTGKANKMAYTFHSASICNWLIGLGALSERINGVQSQTICQRFWKDSIFRLKTGLSTANALKKSCIVDLNSLLKQTLQPINSETQRHSHACSLDSWHLRRLIPSSPPLPNQKVMHQTHKKCFKGHIYQSACPCYWILSGRSHAGRDKSQTAIKISD